MRRVVVTGLGIVSPLGCGVSYVWDRLIQGHSGIRRITECAVEDMSCQIAGQVPKVVEGGPDAPHLFNLGRYLPPKEQRRVGLFIGYALGAAHEALSDAGLLDAPEELRERFGVMIGSGVGGLHGFEENAATLAIKGPRRISPFFIPSSLVNLAAGQVSIQHGLKGPNHATVTACAAGSHAIGDASRLIQFGDADVMLAGGAEGAICRLGVGGFGALRALSTDYNDTPELASRPWDQARDGFVMGDGSGLLVLEELEHAKKRGAKIYGELLGYGLAGDAYHLTSPDPDGGGAFRAMQSALRHARLGPDEIDYLNAHATSTPVGDPLETKAIRRAFGAHVGDVAISSTKSATGHLLGAAGGVEAIFALKALEAGILPPTLNLETPDPEAEGLNLVPKVAQERRCRTVMSNSFGFGGTNAALIFGEYA